MIKKGFIWIFILICFQLNAIAQEMSFSAEASADHVGTQDQFEVVFVLANFPGSVKFSAPDFKGFKVLSGPNQSNGGGASIDFNGKVTRNVVTYISFILTPEKKGVLTINPAQIDANGRKYASNPLTIQAVNGSLARQYSQRQQQQQQQMMGNPFPFPDDELDPVAIMRRMEEEINRMNGRSGMRMVDPRDQREEEIQKTIEKDIGKYVFVKAQVDNVNPYLGQQITVNYKLYSLLSIRPNFKTLPALNGFWSQDFDIPMPPKATSEVINGREYLVLLLKKSALFPQQVGKLTLDPAIIGGSVSYRKEIPINIASAPITINVKPLPTDKQPASFTGAVGSFSVGTTLDKKELSTDDAATFTFTVTGSGNLKLIGNPKIEFPTELGVYEPQITDTITSRNPAITGNKVFSYSMNPQTPGDYVIPAIKFSYYDVASGSYKETETQAFNVHVTKGKNYNPNAAKTAVSLTDIHDINKDAFVVQSAAKPIAGQPWYWLLYGVGLAGFIAAMIRKRQAEKYEGNQALFKNKKANKIAWKRLAEARKRLPEQQHKAFYEEVSKAIWLYLSDKLSIPLSHLSKETVADELTAKQVPDAQIERVKRLVLECEMALYSPSGGQQQREHTLDEASGTIGELEIVLKNKKNAVQYAS